MKIANKFFIGFTAVLFMATADSSAEVNVQINFNELTSYGEWVVVAGYGTVWRPDTDHEWRPFSYGHWVYTNDGWMWDSEEPFGWIVYHYGNWYHDENHGWVWLPGYTWSPARVKWYVTDDEVGWAPLTPNLQYGHRQNAIEMQWIFAPLPFFTSFEIHQHLTIRTALPPNRARVRVNTRPPDRKFIQQKVRTPIISINPNRIHITSRERSLVRVEVQRGDHSNNAVPAIPTNKRATLRNQPEPRNTVIITKERSVEPAAKVRIQSRNDQENQDNNRHDNLQGKQKVKVEVRTR